MFESREEEKKRNQNRCTIVVMYDAYPANKSDIDNVFGRFVDTNKLTQIERGREHQMRFHDIDRQYAEQMPLQ